MSRPRLPRSIIMPCLFLAGGLGLLFIPQLATAQTLDGTQVVEKILQAYGGRNALQHIKTIKHSGSIQSYRLGKTGNLDRLFQRPGTLRVDIAYPGGPTEQRLTTTQGAWRDGHPATVPMHEAMTLQAARFRLPLLLTEKPVIVLGEEGGKLHLGMKLSETTAMEVYVDPKNWRILRSVGRMVMSGMNMAFTADYSDFRKVGGVLFAYREDLTAMGMRTGQVQLKSIEINPKTGPADFMPPPTAGT